MYVAHMSYSRERGLLRICFDDDYGSEATFYGDLLAEPRNPSKFEVLCWDLDLHLRRPGKEHPQWTGLGTGSFRLAVRKPHSLDEVNGWGENGPWLFGPGI